MSFPILIGKFISVHKTIIKIKQKIYTEQLNIQTKLCIHLVMLVLKWLMVPKNVNELIKTTVYRIIIPVDNAEIICMFQ